MDGKIEIASLGADGLPFRKERSDAAANRQLLLETAERLFKEQGVEAVTMADIAKEAGVGKGTLYRRFSTKAELCLALMDNQLANFQSQVFTSLEKFAAADANAQMQLDWFLNALVYFIEDHLPFLCVVQSAGLLPLEGRTQMPHFWQHMTISVLLQQAVQKGQLRDSIDVEYFSDALLAPLRVDLFRYQRERRGFSLERISEGLRVLSTALFLAFSP